MQVRGKRASGAALMSACSAVVRIARPRQALVIVNDRADVALLAAADGVHVGQTDLPAGRVRTLVGPSVVVGTSTHTCDQVDEAAALPVSYIAVGPVFDTATKERPDPTVGLDLVRYAADRAAGRPVVAIGGITLDRARAVLDAGASAVAVISDLFVGNDPTRRVGEYLRQLA